MAATKQNAITRRQFIFQPLLQFETFCIIMTGRRSFLYTGIVPQHPSKKAYMYFYPQLIHVFLLQCLTQWGNYSKCYYSAHNSRYCASLTAMLHCLHSRHSRTLGTDDADMFWVKNWWADRNSICSFHNWNNSEPSRTFWPQAKLHPVYRWFSKNSTAHLPGHELLYKPICV